MGWAGASEKEKRERERERETKSKHSNKPRPNRQYTDPHIDFKEKLEKRTFKENPRALLHILVTFL